jgi:hypothetical protein
VVIVGLLMMVVGAVSTEPLGTALGKAFAILILALVGLCLLKAVLIVTLCLLKTAVIVLTILGGILTGVLLVAWCVASFKSRLSTSKQEGESYE